MLSNFSILKQSAIVIPFSIHNSILRVVNEFLQTAAKQFWLFLLYLYGVNPYMLI